ADAEAIAKMGAATFANSFGYSMPAEHLQAYLAEAYTPTAIAKDLANEQNHFFVARLNSARAEENGKVVGFIQMKLGTTERCIPSDVPTCELHRIYVSFDQVGGGIGQLMMERGLQWAREQLLGSELHNGATVAGVWLGVWEENVKAERFYRRWGFERVGAHDFAMGDTRQTDSVM
ncbi:acyl-CoA N-acyltransferase, partial [Usnea florida]